MDKQFLAQELNAPITKNHRDGLSNRPAQPIVTISLNERNAVINNRETIVRSTINKPHHTNIMINTIFEKDDFSVSDTGCFLSVPMRNDRDVMVKLEPGPSRFKGWITLSMG